MGENGINGVFGVMGGLVGYWVGLVWLVGWKIERVEIKKPKFKKNLGLVFGNWTKDPVLRKSLFKSKTKLLEAGTEVPVPKCF